jgi:DNA-directed RNA polymerase I subunit RPA43
MSVEVVSSKRRFSDSNDSEITLKKQKAGISTDESKVSIIDEKTGLSKCFHRVRAKMYLSLAPCHLAHPLNGLRQQHLDPLIMTFNRTVDGIIISYDNIKFAKDQIKKNEDNEGYEDVEFDYVAKVADENPFSFLWVYVDFVVWKPHIGDLLEGYSIMQSQSHIGLLIHDVFNASIKKFYIPENWYFVPNQADESNENGDSNESNQSNFKKLGHWCDENGIAIGGKIKFTVRAIHVNGKGLAIEGTLLTPGMEKDSQPVAMVEQIKENIKNHVKFGFEDDTEAVDVLNIDKEDNINNSNKKNETFDIIVDEEKTEAEMKESLPIIAPVQEEAPVYRDDSSSDSLESDSDSDSDKAKTAGSGSDDSDDSSNSSSDGEDSSD